jgi:cell division protein FtsZ
MLELDLTQDETASGTNIKIIGVGGAGGNAVNTMINNALGGVEFIAANTDIADLKKSKAKIRLQMGKESAKGLGTGAIPEKGQEAAEESKEEIRSLLHDTDMIFITAGMGGGTGTGAAPVIASIAKEMGILTIAIVTRPFMWEGKKRIVNAEDGIKRLRENIDTLMIIPNAKLEELYPDMDFVEAYQTADNILYDAAKAISDIINYTGLMNVDFADVQTVMQNRGLALMGTGIGTGEDRAVYAATEAMKNPLLADISLKNAKGILINITACKAKMNEIRSINQTIVEEAGDGGDIITGFITNPDMTDEIKVTLIATGLNTIGTSKYEVEKIKSNAAGNNENLSDTIIRIREARKTDIRKEIPEEASVKSKGFQMEIPAFMRKLSN